MTTSTDLTIIIPPCPPWCTQPANHGYEQLTDGTMGRSHWGDDTAETAAKAWPATFETVTGDRVERQAAWVTIATGEGDQLTPDEARALASELVRAANAIDQG
jgi:hypothetical protein